MQAYDHFGGVPGPWTPEEAPGKRVRVSQQESARSNVCLAHHSLVIERGSPLRATIAVSSFQQCRISAKFHGRSERGMQTKEWIEKKKTMPPNFQRFVLGCIDADFCNKILNYQNLSRTTRSYILLHHSNLNILTTAVNKFRRMKN